MKRCGELHTCVSASSDGCVAALLRFSVNPGLLICSEMMFCGCTDSGYSTTDPNRLSSHLFSSLLYTFCSYKTQMSLRLLLIGWCSHQILCRWESRARSPTTLYMIGRARDSHRRVQAFKWRNNWSYHNHTTLYMILAAARWARRPIVLSIVLLPSR